MKDYLAKLSRHLDRKEPFYTRDILTEEIFDIGEYTYGVPKVHFDTDFPMQLRIGKFCSIAPAVEIFLGMNHRLDWCTTYPFSSPVPQVRDLWPEAADIKGFPSSYGDVNIGHDVWLGLGATILSGVTIGAGAAVGAKAVVTNDVPPYAVAVGNPAKVVKMRFAEQTIAKLLEFQWWHWPVEKIRRALPLLCSERIDELITF